jgi:choline dehydrogenase-like flavoprotein
MGCPSGGKFSMDLSYVPMALRHGALLLTETRLSRVVIREGRVRGVELESGGRRLAAAARRVVLCCGTLATPRVLWDHDLGGPAVGRNLTIHPSGSVSTRLDRDVAGYGDVVPSSHFVDAFKDRGMMLISANVPVDMAAMPLQLVGLDLMTEMERYERFGSWGVLLAESTKGRLVRLPGGRVACSYSMSQADVDRVQWALAKICEIYFEAGAEACFPAVWGQPVVRNRLELSWFRAARLSARQLVLTAYHPLGTCRMGNDPRRSVVDTDYQVRGVEGLSIVDGSVVPGPLGVNSQLTVMAFAHRAAGILHRQLEES